MSIKKIKVIFSGIPEFMNNNILDSTHMKKFPGGEAFYVIANKLISNGYDFTTIDRYLSSNDKKIAFLISDMSLGSDLSTNLIPIFCMSQESPIVAYRYYHYLEKRTQKFFKIWDWPGVFSRIDNYKSRFIPNSWPNTSKPINNIIPWNQKKFLAIVNSNK